MIKKDTVIKLAEERMEELNNNLFIVELTISSNNLIQLELDKMDGGVSIEDCVSVSRNIEHNLDREAEDFELQVSSAGLDKPLRVVQQYIKNIGRTIKIQLVENHQTIEGELVAADEKGIVLKTEAKERVEGKKKKIVVVRETEFTYDQIKETKIVISFKK